MEQILWLFQPPLVTKLLDFQSELLYQFKVILPVFTNVLRSLYPSVFISIMPSIGLQMVSALRGRGVLFHPEPSMCVSDVCVRPVCFHSAPCSRPSWPCCWVCACSSCLPGPAWSCPWASSPGVTPWPTTARGPTGTSAQKPSHRTAWMFLLWGRKLEVLDTIYRLETRSL